MSCSLATPQSSNPPLLSSRFIPLTARVPGELLDIETERFKPFPTGFFTSPLLDVVPEPINRIGASTEYDFSDFVVCEILLVLQFSLNSIFHLVGGGRRVGFSSKSHFVHDFPLEVAPAGPIGIGLDEAPSKRVFEIPASRFVDFPEQRDCTHYIIPENSLRTRLVGQEFFQQFWFGMSLKQADVLEATGESITDYTFATVSVLGNIVLAAAEDEVPVDFIEQSTITVGVFIVGHCIFTHGTNNLLQRFKFYGLLWIHEMPTQTEERTHTTLWVSKDTASRLDAMKPFESLSWDEFLDELADIYQEHQR